MFDPIEMIGYAAAMATIATYAMRTMLPLRIAAIASSVLFLVYAGSKEIYPQIALHAVLLPFNLYRLLELWRLSRAARTARTNCSESDLALFRRIGRQQTRDAGSFLFRKGDAPDFVYFIVAGRVRLVELGITLGPGEVLGEMAFFTDAARRSASALCEDTVILRVIDEDAFMRIYFQSPAFALAVQKLITRRLIAAQEGSGTLHFTDAVPTKGQEPL